MARHQTSIPCPAEIFIDTNPVLEHYELTCSHRTNLGSQQQLLLEYSATHKENKFHIKFKHSFYDLLPQLRNDNLVNTIPEVRFAIKVLWQVCFKLNNGQALDLPVVNKLVSGVGVIGRALLRLCLNSSAKSRPQT
jgi:hypothetical protein